MTPPEPPFPDPAAARRWFAVECNNLAWDLVEAPDRSADQTERMLHAAHASCHHWMEAGGVVNHLRALYLLATAYAAAGLGEPAARYAGQALDLLPGTEPTPFDLACTHGAAARAFELAGRAEDAAAQRAELSRAAGGLSGEEREVVGRLYGG